MSLDRSLKTAGGLDKHRNVLTRAERVSKLMGKELFDMSKGNPLGLPKVGNRKVAPGGKAAKKADATAEGEATAAGAAAPAAKAAKAAPAKAAAPKAAPAAKAKK